MSEEEVSEEQEEGNEAEEKESKDVIEALEEPVTGFYEGERLRFLRHGKGTFYFNNGARYTGEWRDGLKYGAGTFIYPDGSTYRGQWVQNRKHGYGRYTYVNGDIYDGQWFLDKKTGCGYCIHASTGSIFKTYFFEDKMNGPVTIRMGSMIFIGTYKDGQPYGIGRYLMRDNLVQYGKYVLRGKAQKPVWVAGELVRE